MRIMTNKKNNWILYCLLGVLIRLGISQLGYNHDIGVWNRVGDGIINGVNMYSDFPKILYPYLPLWSLILGLLKTIQNFFGNQEIQVFHLLCCLVLSLVDVWIATLLKKNFSIKAGLIFLFNPISLLITGYHSQIDNLAVLFALLGYLAIFNNGKLNWLVGGIWFGLSLATKHFIIFFLPFFFFAPKKIINFKHRIFTLGISSLIPILITIPFIADGNAFNGFVRSVLYYNSMDHGAIFQEIFRILPVNDSIQIPFISGKTELSKLLFIISLSAIVFTQGFRQNKETFFIYLAALVGLSSGIADQYFAIPLVAVALYFDYVEIKIFTIYIAGYLLLDSPFNIGGELQQFDFIQPFITIINMFFKAAIGQILLLVFVFRQLFFQKATSNKLLLNSFS